MEYDMEITEGALMSPMHNMGSFEYLGVWGRCWFDLGTSDLIAIDILINALNQINKEYVQISKLIFGGQNDDWPIEATESSVFLDSSEKRRYSDQ
jgi:hypothetical protein